MRTTVVLVLCFYGLAMAAEEKSNRSSRQILHPLVPLIHNSHIGYNLGHHLPAVQYVQPAVHSLALTQQVWPHSTFQPLAFNGQLNYPHQYHSPRYHYIPHTQQYPQVMPQLAGFSFGGRQDGFQPQSARFSANNEQSNESLRPAFQQPSEASFQSPNTPSQEYSEAQNFQPDSPQNQNYRVPSLQSSPEFSQSQAPRRPSGLSAYRPMARLYAPSQANVLYPSDVSNSQPAQNQQETRDFVSRPLDQQSSSQQGSATPILSQSGQIRNDGSYNYRFRSGNGIMRTETSEVRPGLYRHEERSYTS